MNIKNTVRYVIGACLVNTDFFYVDGVFVVVCLMKKCCFVNSLISNFFITKLQLHQLHKTIPITPNYTKLHQLHKTTTNYTNYTKLHQTTPTTPNYTNYTKLHQTTPTTQNYTKLHQRNKTTPNYAY